MLLRQIALVVTVVCLAWPGTSGAAEDAMKKLEIFSDAPLEKGLWRMEILESSAPDLAANSAKMGKAAICMDVAREITEAGDADSGEQLQDDDDSDCTQKIVRDTASVGEIEVTCKDGDRTQVVLTKEAPKTYLFETKRTDTEGEVETMKGRYTYQGPCKGDALIQMDRDSEACKQMREQMGPGGGAAMCAQLPEEHRAACEQRMKSLTAMCD